MLQKSGNRIFGAWNELCLHRSMQPAMPSPGSGSGERLGATGEAKRGSLGSRYLKALREMAKPSSYSQSWSRGTSSIVLPWASGTHPQQRPHQHRQEVHLAGEQVLLQSSLSDEDTELQSDSQEAARSGLECKQADPSHRQGAPAVTPVPLRCQYGVEGETHAVQPSRAEGETHAVQPSRAEEGETHAVQPSRAEEGETHAVQPSRAEEGETHAVQPSRAEEGETHAVQPSRAEEGETHTVQPSRAEEGETHAVQPSRATALKFFPEDGRAFDYRPYRGWEGKGGRQGVTERDSLLLATEGCSYVQQDDHARFCLDLSALGCSNSLSAGCPGPRDAPRRSIELPVCAVVGAFCTRCSVSVKDEVCMSHKISSEAQRFAVLVQESALCVQSGRGRTSPTAWHQVLAGSSSA
ncbi:uncharacterized protein [Symphalangus syndactylus]|uniref:uncharacterized protein n=1 Tax=Symphalangus syndactylus TaxID=9590 RepID=UPI003007487B